jgi:cytochrome c oxidase subunit 2
MDKAENAVLVLSGLLMVLFFGMLVYAARGLNISLPTCVTDLAPFKEGKVIDEGNQHYELHLVAKMWAFEPAEVRLPPGADVEIYLSALDVTHGAYIEHTNVNLMAVPGAVNAARVRFDKEGEYDVVCHEYCGLGHQNMMGKIIVAKGAVAVQPAAAAARAVSAIERGKELFQTAGCAACHSIDGSPGVGPTVKGLYNRETELADGSTVKADEEYIEESIRKPNAQIVKGFQPLMPEVPLTHDQVDDLVEYLETLS